MGTHTASTKRAALLAVGLCAASITGIVATLDALSSMQLAAIAIAVLTLTLAPAAAMHAFARETAAARRDPLTGLEFASTLASRLDEQGARGALLYLDLDGFDKVNDRIGRPAADRLLRSISDMLRTFVTREHALARLGGDEFGLFLSHATAQEALHVADRIRRMIADIRFAEREHVVDVGVSMGIAVVREGVGSDEVLRRAHAACRDAKTRGRNRVEMYRPVLSEQAREESDPEWTIRLKDAIRDERLAVVFQPIVDVTTQQVSHYEALVRLFTDDGSAIAADTFITTAERCGLIQEIDRFVIRTSLARIASESLLGNSIRVAINLSGLSLDEDSIAEIRSRILASGITPSSICFEITETAAIANIAATRHAIETLRALGCTFALDDFGKGMSSFAYLRYLPVDTLKIDGAFVRNLPDDLVDEAMVRSMTELAHSLGMKIVAECVESAATLRTLNRLGVDLAQGFFVGRPSDRLARALVVLPDSPVTAASPSNNVEIRLPLHNPAEMIELVRFLDQLDIRSRELRDAGNLDAAAVTLPDEFDELVAGLMGTMREQAEAAVRAGDAILEMRLPMDLRLVDLVRWSEPRLEALVQLARSGAVQTEWERPVTILADVFREVRSQIAARETA